MRGRPARTAGPPITVLLPAVRGLVVIAGTTPIGRAPRLMLVGGAVDVDGADGAVGAVGAVGADGAGGADGADALLGLTLARQHQRHITRPTASGPEQTRSHTAPSAEACGSGDALSATDTAEVGSPDSGHATEGSGLKAEPYDSDGRPEAASQAAAAVSHQYREKLPSSPQQA